MSYAKLNRIQRIKNMVFRCKGFCGKEWRFRMYGDVKLKPGETREQLAQRAAEMLAHAIVSKTEDMLSKPCDLCKGEVKRNA